MTMKHHACNLHAALKDAGVTALSRSHVRELVAAASGSRTYAGYQQEMVVCDVPWAMAGRQPSATKVRERCVSLGLSPDDAVHVAGIAMTYQIAMPHAPLRLE